MPTRSKTDLKREALKNWLRAQFHGGAFQHGQSLPSIRELAAQFDLSRIVTNETLSELQDEGVVTIKPRVGLFLGSAQPVNNRFFLLVVSTQMMQMPQLSAILGGFEQRISQRGGSVLMMELSQARSHQQRGEMPDIAGVFDLSYDPVQKTGWSSDMEKTRTPSHIPRVRFGGSTEKPKDDDLISFDDFDGGLKATRHLIESGHHDIGFVNVTPAHDDTQLVSWAIQREKGWRQALKEQGRTNNHCWRPKKSVDTFNVEQLIELGKELTLAHWQKSQPSALVTVNSFIARGVIAGLEKLNISPEQWPAIVSFDDDAKPQPRFFTAMQLDWREVGNIAANLLWARAFASSSDLPMHCKISMNLQQRLTSQLRWGHDSSRVALVQASFQVEVA